MVLKSKTTTVIPLVLNTGREEAVEIETAANQVLPELNKHVDDTAGGEEVVNDEYGDTAEFEVTDIPNTAKSLQKYPVKLKVLEERKLWKLQLTRCFLN